MIVKPNEESNIKEEIENPLPNEAKERIYHQLNDSESKYQMFSDQLNFSQTKINTNLASNSTLKRKLEPNQKFHQKDKSGKNSVTNISQSEKSFICEICQKSVNHSMHLIFHRKRHLSLNSINCRICLELFSAEKEKIVHENQCNKLRYDCYACGMILSSLDSLKYHFRVHSGFGSFKCENSPKRFKRSNK